MSKIIQHAKSLGRRDLVLFTVSAILLLDTLAAGAAGGPSVVFWWVFLGFVFFIPNAMICAELGCTFPEQGGIYAWVRDAYGQRWGARTSWYYWINIAVWLPSIYILFAAIFAQLFMPGLSLWAQVVIAIAITWLTVVVNILALNIGKWVPNIGAMFKLVIFTVLILGGVNYALKEGSATAFTLVSMTPSLSDAPSFFGVILYGMLGFELVSASSEDMKNPKRDIPMATFLSGLIIIVAYTVASIAILVAIPAEEINLVEGLMDTLLLFVGDSAAGQAVVQVLGVAALYTFFSNGTTWALGGNRAAAETAAAGELPRFIGIENPSNGSPIGAAILMGVIATTILVLFGFIADSNEDLFWALFSFSAVLFMLPYVAMNLSFLKLRTKYPDQARPFKVPGGLLGARTLAYLCTWILVTAIALFCYVPGEGIQWPVLVGSLSLILVGEVCIRTSEISEPRSTTVDS